MNSTLIQLKTNISIRKMHWLTQDLRIVNFKWKQVSLQQHSILRETSFLNLYREGEKNISLVCFLLPLKREKAMASHSSTLAWKIPWTEEPWQAAVHGVAKSWTRLSDFTFTFHFHALEKEMATHSSVLAWRIPGTREPGGLPSMGSHTVRHD